MNYDNGISDDDDLEMDENGSDGVEIVDFVEEPHKEDNSAAKIAVHSKDVFCLALSPDGHWLASGSEDETAAVWDLRHGMTSPLLHRTISSHSDSVHLLAWNVSANILASADMAGRIICTKVTGDEATQTASLTIDDCFVQPSQRDDCNEENEEGQGSDPEQIGWLFWHSTVDGILFAGCNDGSLWMWLVVQRECQSVFAVHQSKVFTTNSSSPCSAALLLSDAKFLLAAYENSVARIWDLKEANPVEISLPGPSSGAIDANFGANLAAIGCKNGFTALINTTQKNARHLHTFQTKGRTDDDGSTDESVEFVRFAPDGLNWLAVGTSAGYLTIFDWEKCSSRHECEHDGESVVSCAWLFGTDRSVSLISACIDGAIRIWDAKSGEPLALLLGAEEEIYYLCVAKDGDGRIFLFSACANGTVRIFRLTDNELTRAES
ncbi:hypothetical protein niasHT_013431 [Heterodera trifolii]|uniref:Uncharacterized protein n=1 Tax=Heterodera trifolii TaxID=157864 RepID=A0ABD2LCP5_9BILA